jgi:DNA-binding beta-propeller fold protein YncE
MTFDSKGNLYVANAGNNTITVYARGELTKVARTITQGVNGPVALAMGSQ